jgi:GGDEF domain-containing protein
MIQGIESLKRPRRFSRASADRETFLPASVAMSFALLMPNTGTEEAYEIIHTIGTEFERYNEALADKAMVINLSFGSSTKGSIF